MSKVPIGVDNAQHEGWVVITVEVCNMDSWESDTLLERR